MRPPFSFPGFGQGNVERLLVGIDRKLDIILRRTSIMSKELDDLSSEVSNVTTVEQSAITLINGLADQIKAAGTDPAKLQALTDSLTASSNSLAAAVAANTAPPSDNTPPAAA